MNSIIKQNDKGFTLAEVLLTLLIIGVVASLVVPNLINDSKQAEYITAWKKTYAELDQITRQIVMDNGGTMVGASNSTSTLRNLYGEHLSYIKTCNAGFSYGNCWTEKIHWLDGSVYSSMVDRPAAVLNNGVALLFYWNDTSCTGNHWAGGLKDCGTIVADTNGIKAPNKIGADIHFIHVSEFSLKPWGSPGDWWQPATHCKSTCGWACSWACAAKYLMQ